MTVGEFKKYLENMKVPDDAEITVHRPEGYYYEESWIYPKEAFYYTAENELTMEE